MPKNKMYKGMQGGTDMKDIITLRMETKKDKSPDRVNNIQ